MFACGAIGSRFPAKLICLPPRHVRVAVLDYRATYSATKYWANPISLWTPTEQPVTALPQPTPNVCTASAPAGLLPRRRKSTQRSFYTPREQKRTCLNFRNKQTVHSVAGFEKPLKNNDFLSVEPSNQSCPSQNFASDRVDCHQTRPRPSGQSSYLPCIGDAMMCALNARARTLPVRCSDCFDAPGMARRFSPRSLR